MKRAFLFCLIFSAAIRLFSTESFFDNYVYQNWNSFGGLTGATATDLIQTSGGYLNIGTYEGLVRFDGVRFSTIKRGRTNDLNFASVRAIYEDSKGNIWVGSNDEGLQKISKDGNKSYTTHNGLPNNSVRAIVEDTFGNIWIGTAAGVVYLTPNGHLITPQFQAGTVSKGIISTNLYLDTAGRVWLVTANEKGLFLFSDGLFRTRPELEEFGNYFVTSITQDLKGDFWIGMGERGLFRIRNGNVSSVKSGTFLDNTSTCSTYVAKDGTIWFGTEKGLCVFSGGQFHEYKGAELATAKINKLICDREGNIWFATDRNGIGKLTHGKFSVKKIKTTVNAITEGIDGKIWLGTDNGVFCWTNNHMESNELTEYTKGIRIRHVEKTSSGDILVSCYSKPGQILYSKNGIKSWSTDEGLAGNKVRVAIEASQDEFYVGTTTGMSIIHADGSIRNFKQIDGLENEYVMCIYKDTNGVVWIGTDGDGVYLMKNEAIFAHITSEDGLTGNVIFKIRQDKEGAYWICSGSGITRCPPFDSGHTLPSSYERINSEQGIGTDSVFQIVSDKSGSLWLTSNYGIASVKESELVDVSTGAKSFADVKYYGRNDGLDSDGPTSTSVSICDSNGRIWFPMVDGFAVYDPVNVKENPVNPFVHIENVTIDNIVYNNVSDEFILKPGTKRVDINFTGISFDAPERIKFTHQLTNFDEAPSEPKSVRTVSYTNLRPGKHAFIVNAINGDGLMSERAEVMLFVQKPYFYQMPGFWIAVAILALAAVFIVFNLKERAMKLENIRLEKIVNERTAELKTEKDKSDMLLRAILPEKIANELKDEIHSIGENFSDVTLLFSDIVSFTKTSSKYSAAEVVDALNALFSLFDERAKRSGVEKIKTIGDAYMAACGVPTPNENHARIMVDFARGMYEDLATYNKTAKIHFNMRIGLNCGPVTAGVIGKTKFIYDVWGDTVNTASRMETACSPGQIRVSQAVYEHLRDSDVQFTSPIECDIKGKGMMITYEVVQEDF